MAKRTVENCSLMKKQRRYGYGTPEIEFDGKCLGYSVSSTDDEPCETCKNCKLNSAYEYEMQDEYIRTGYWTTAHKLEPIILKSQVKRLTFSFNYDIIIIEIKY